MPVVKSMMALIRHPQRSVTISERRDPNAYFCTRVSLWVRGGFRDLIVANAKSVEAGTTFKVNEDELGEPLTDKQIVNGLPEKHLWDESSVAAVVAELIRSGALDKKNWYLLYTSSCVVLVSWCAGVDGWGVGAGDRGGSWLAGARVLSPAN